jgi:hypothetical protein
MEEGKNMQTKRTPKLLVVVLTLALLLSACGAANTEPTATPISIEAVYTAAAETLSAQLTQSASVMPSATMTVTASPTITNTPAATETFQVAPTNTSLFLSASTTIPLATITPGPSPTPSATPTARTLGCHNSEFVSHITIPNNTVMQPGEAFTKIWEVRNLGTSAECNWNNDYRLVFVGGDILGSDSTRIGQKVGIGASARVRLEMVAPTAPGTYTSYWRMATPQWESFGEVFSVTIVVPGPTHTPTSPTTNTPTNTPEPPTNTPTNTVEPPTATPTP